MKTRITEMLGIEYPIIQGGMAWVAEDVYKRQGQNSVRILTG